MKYKAITLFDDEKWIELLELYKKYRSDYEMADETGLSQTYCRAIYKKPKEQRFSQLAANVIKKTLVEFRNRMSDENITNSEVKTDAFYNSHVVSDFDKSNKQVLRETILREIISEVKKKNMSELMNLYLDLNIGEEKDNEEKAL